MAGCRSVSAQHRLNSNTALQDTVFFHLKSVALFFYTRYNENKMEDNPWDKKKN